MRPEHLFLSLVLHRVSFDLFDPRVPFQICIIEVSGMFGSNRRTAGTALLHDAASPAFCTPKTPHTPVNARRSVASSSRSPFTMSTPWRASAAACSLSGLRVRPRRWNLAPAAPAALLQTVRSAFQLPSHCCAPAAEKPDQSAHRRATTRQQRIPLSSTMML